MHPSPAAGEAGTDEVWARVCAKAPTEAARALLTSLRLSSLIAGRAVVTAKDASSAAFAGRKADLLGKLLAETLGGPVKVEIVSDAAPAVERAAAPTDSAALGHPLVKQAMELFEASVVSIEQTSPPRQGADEAGGHERV